MGVQGKDFHHLGRRPGEKRQELFLEGWEYWKGYQGRDLIQRSKTKIMLPEEGTRWEADPRKKTESHL